MVWDPSTDQFVMVCATDNQGRVARPNPYRTIWVVQDLPTPSIGDLVVADGRDYWVSASDQGTIHLLHFDSVEPDQDVTAGSSDFSHLTNYGTGRMLLTWEAGSSIAASNSPLSHAEKLPPSACA